MGSLIGAISSQKVTFNVALPAGDGGKSIRLYAGTSEYPALPGRANDLVKMRRVRTISRKGRERPSDRWHAESSETARRTSRALGEMMIQSVLYGDVERPAEMPGPLETTHPSNRLGARKRTGVTRRTEECKGTLSPVGNRASSVKV